MKFRVSSLLTLKLKDGKTIIYVKGEEFIQCKYLLIVNPFKNFENIKSIDDAKETLKTHLEKEITISELGITPEQEFWGHCSNIQTWVENDYNPDLIHSNLSFPLLKKLWEKGDLKALSVLKNLIIKKIRSQDDSFLFKLIKLNYISFLNVEELESLGLKDLAILRRIEGLIDEKSCLQMEIDLSETFSYTLENRRITQISIVNPAKDLSFASISSYLIDLVKLRTLNLIECGLYDIPKQVEFLKNLETLNLIDNDIKKLPHFIFDMIKLKSINLKNNKISDFNIKKIKKDIDINLENNPITVLEK